MSPWLAGSRRADPLSVTRSVTSLVSNGDHDIDVAGASMAGHVAERLT
jgi:hypothetical protein